MPSPLWAPFWAEELRKSRAKVAAVKRDGSGAQTYASAGRTTDVGASRRTTDGAAKARASSSSLSVGSDDPRAMEMAMREDSDTRASAPRTSGVDVRGLTAATERWSAAEPAADGAFRTPSQVCEFVMLPGVTGESRDRSRGMHVLITKP